MQPRIASPKTFDPHLTEVLMSDLLAPRDLEVEIQFIHNEDALVAIEIVADREPDDVTAKVVREFTTEDFVTTIKFPRELLVEGEGTSPFVRHSAPYELVEMLAF